MADVSYHFLDAGNAARVASANVFDHAVIPDQLEAFIDSAEHVLVFAENASSVVGFASATRVLHPDKPPSCFINEVGVNDPFRRQGIATRLCQELLDWARANGCESIWLATETDNAPARALYRSMAAGETADVVVYDWQGAKPS